MRKVVPETTLVWFIFFFLTLGWQWIAQTNPIWHEVDKSLQPTNEFLQFFLISFLIFCILIVQTIIRVILT